jgi:hypothetical protein
MLRQISLPIARMKRYLLILLTALGLIAFAPTKSRAQDFSVSFGGAPGYYAPGYYGEPGSGYYYRRVYYRPAYYYGEYYGGYYHRRHHRCHHWHGDENDD